MSARGNVWQTGQTFALATMSTLVRAAEALAVATERRSRAVSLDRYVADQDVARAARAVRKENVSPLRPG